MSKAFDLGAQTSVKLASLEKEAFLKNLLAMLGKGLMRGGMGVSNAIGGTGNKATAWMARQARLTPAQLKAVQSMKIQPGKMGDPLASQSYAKGLVDNNFANIGGVAAGGIGGLGLASAAGGFNREEDRDYPYPIPTTQARIEGNM